MAAIGSIRKHSTLLLIIVALALLAFLLGDFSRSNSGNKVYDKFITIGNQNISYNNFLDKHNSIRSLYRGQQLTPDQEFSLNVQAYDELIDSIALGKQANYLGITITADELRDLVAGPNPHPEARRFFSGGGGAYDMQVAQQFLDNMDQYPDTAIVFYYMGYIEPMIEKDAFMSKYFNLLTGAYHLPKAFAEKMANESMLKTTIEVVQLPYSSPLASDDKVSFTEDEVKKCYEKNKYRFKQDEELRSVEYAIFNIEPTEQDLRNIEEEVQAMFEEFKQAERPDYFVNRLVDSRYDSTYYKQGELGQAIDTLLFNAPEGSFAEPFIEGEYWRFAKLLSTQIRPDSLNISLIGVAHQGVENAPRKKEDADKIVDSAYMMARMGMDFYEVARQYSDIPVEQQPDQGRIWLEDGKMDQLTQLFFDSLNMLPVGSVKKMDLPKYGATYILRVNEKTEPQRKIRVAIGQKYITPSRETVNNIENRANNFVNGTDNYQKFKEATATYNVDPRINDRVQKMDYTLPGVPSGGREIIRWIYGEDTKKGMVSQVFTLEDMYVVVVVKDIYAKGYRTLDQEQVRNQIETIVKRDKKAELLENALKQSLNSGLSTIAANNNVLVDTITVSFADRNFGRYGPEGKVIGKLFATKDGSTEILKGDMGVYAVKINGFDVPSMDVSQSLQSNVEMIMMQNKMMNQNRFQNGVRSMRKIYEIKDNMILVM